MLYHKRILIWIRMKRYHTWLVVDIRAHFSMNKNPNIFFWEKLCIFLCETWIVCAAYLFLDCCILAHFEMSYLNFTIDTIQCCRAINFLNHVSTKLIDGNKIENHFNEKFQLIDLVWNCKSVRMQCKLNIFYCEILKLWFLVISHHVSSLLWLI